MTTHMPSLGISTARLWRSQGIHAYHSTILASRSNLKSRSMDTRIINMRTFTAKRIIPHANQPRCRHRGPIFIGLFATWRGRAALTFSASAIAFLEHSIPRHELEIPRHPRAIVISRVSEPSFIVRLFHAVFSFLQDWIYEPIRTSLRFVHLAVIFLPVMVTAPALFFGARDPNRDDEKAGALWWYAFLVRQMESAGPTFIKLAQWAASRTDIFPMQLCNYMSKLHSNVDAHSFRSTRKAINHAFDGHSVEEIFEQFEEKPLGIGAIAQVYKARLNPDYVPEHLRQVQEPQKKAFDFNPSPPPKTPTQDIAIKVLHPYAKAMIRRDLRIMAFFAYVLDAVPGMSWLSFPDEVRNFGELMQMQLDLRIESEHLEKFEANFADRHTVSFPRPLRDYATEELLAEEYMYGLPLHMFLENGAGPFSKKIAGMGLDAFLNMLLHDNFIHADLHPGNIIIRFHKVTAKSTLRSVWKSLMGRDVGELPSYDMGVERLKPKSRDKQAWLEELEKLEDEGFQPQVVFIDAGLVTSLNDVNRRNFIDLFRAVAEFDGYRAGKLMVERCKSPDQVIDSEVFALKMQHLVLGVKSQTFSLAKIQISDVLKNVLSMVRSHHVRLEGDFINVVISILLLEGIGRQLDPDTDLFASALPILRRIGAAGGAKGALEAMPSGETNWMFKIWFLMEARQFASTAIGDIEHLVKSDLLCPNV